jgi:hypothetical protein
MVKKVGAFGPCNQNGLELVVKKGGAFGPYAQNDLDGCLRKLERLSHLIRMI